MACDFASNAITLFLVESMYFDETSDEKAVKKAKHKEKARAKAKVVEAEKVRLRKRGRTDDVCEDNHPSSPHLNQPLMAHTNMEPPLNLHHHPSCTIYCCIFNNINGDASGDIISSDNEDVRDTVTLQADR